MDNEGEMKNGLMTKQRYVMMLPGHYADTRIKGRGLENKTRITGHTFQGRWSKQITNWMGMIKCKIIGIKRSNSNDET